MDSITQQCNIIETLNFCELQDLDKNNIEMYFEKVHMNISLLYERIANSIESLGIIIGYVTKNENGVTVTTRGDLINPKCGAYKQFISSQQGERKRVPCNGQVSAKPWLQKVDIPCNVSNGKSPQMRLSSYHKVEAKPPDNISIHSSRLDPEPRRSINRTSTGPITEGQSHIITKSPQLDPEHHGDRPSRRVSDHMRKTLASIVENIRDSSPEEDAINDQNRSHLTKPDVSPIKSLEGDQLSKMKETKPSVEIELKAKSELITPEQILEEIKSIINSPGKTSHEDIEEDKIPERLLDPNQMIKFSSSTPSNADKRESHAKLHEPGEKLSPESMIEKQSISVKSSQRQHTPTVESPTVIPVPSVVHSPRPSENMSHAESEQCKVGICQCGDAKLTPIVKPPKPCKCKLCQCVDPTPEVKVPQVASAPCKCKICQCVDPRVAPAAKVPLVESQRTSRSREKTIGDISTLITEELERKLTSLESAKNFALSSPDIIIRTPKVSLESQRSSASKERSIGQISERVIEELQRKLTSLETENAKSPLSTDSLNGRVSSPLAETGITIGDITSIVTDELERRLTLLKSEKKSVPLSADGDTDTVKSPRLESAGVMSPQVEPEVVKPSFDKKFQPDPASISKDPSTGPITEKQSISVKSPQPEPKVGSPTIIPVTSSTANRRKSTMKSLVTEELERKLTLLESDKDKLQPSKKDESSLLKIDPDVSGIKSDQSITKEVKSSLEPEKKSMDEPVDPKQILEEIKVIIKSSDKLSHVSAVGDTSKQPEDVLSPKGGDVSKEAKIPTRTPSQAAGEPSSTKSPDKISHVTLEDKASWQQPEGVLSPKDRGMLKETGKIKELSAVLPKSTTEEVVIKTQELDVHESRVQEPESKIIEPHESRSPTDEPFIDEVQPSEQKSISGTLKAPKQASTLLLDVVADEIDLEAYKKQPNLSTVSDESLSLSKASKERSLVDIKTPDVAQKEPSLRGTIHDIPVTASLEQVDIKSKEDDIVPKKICKSKEDKTEKGLKMSLLNSAAALAAVEEFIRKHSQKPKAIYPQVSTDTKIYESPTGSDRWIAPKPPRICATGKARKIKRLPAEVVDAELMKQLRKLNDCTATLEIPSIESTGSVGQLRREPKPKPKCVRNKSPEYYWKYE